jgi:serine protease inhibitor
VYFKGVWEYPFDKSRTNAQAFGAKEGSKVRIAAQEVPNVVRATA